MKIIITGTPQAKQSARFKIQKSKKTDKNFVMSYQKKSVVDNASNIGKVALSQLPLGFVPFDCAIAAKVTFVFPALSSWDKATKLLFESGTTIYKTSKPDVDNCLKALFDGLNGIVFVDDSRVSRVLSEKIYGKEPRIEIEFYKL
jgi:Holliday junction resolvase RusA-like endonuclease